MPHAGAIDAVEHHVVLVEISTHAPRVGSDLNPLHRRIFSNISTHAPRVGSDYDGGTETVLTGLFQLTLPVWGATVIKIKLTAIDKFQLTLPVWGATCPRHMFHTRRYTFQLTLPVWGATCTCR